MRFFATCMLLLALPVLAPAADTSEPCTSPEHRQFDFWLGSWDVFTPDGRKVGHNEIRSEYGGCVIHERYQTPGKFRGESLNSYDSARKTWHQTWVDNAGTLLLLDGAWDGAAMQLSGSTLNAQGQRLGQRIRWSQNPDGSVRQHWEQSTDGESWTTVFDGEYRRAKRASK